VAVATEGGAEAAAPEAPAAVADVADVAGAEIDIDDSVDVATEPSATASVRRRPAPGAAGTRRGPR
jgi:hypothetical protein